MGYAIGEPDDLNLIMIVLFRKPWICQWSLRSDGERRRTLIIINNLQVNFVTRLLVSLFNSSSFTTKSQWYSSFDLNVPSYILGFPTSSNEKDRFSE